MTDRVVLATFQTYSVLIGVVIGSFLTVCIARLPEDRSVVPRSHCPRCGHKLGPVELVPVLSWVVQRGRCRHCGAPIPAWYPLVELLGGLLGWLVFARVVGGVGDLDVAHAAAWVVWFGFLCLLVVAALVDVRHWIIPDQTSVYAIPFGVLAAAVLQRLGYTGWPSVGWPQAVLGALMGASTLAAASLGARFVLRREALGWGDVKLLGMIGAFVGPAQVVFLVLLPASLIGSVAGLAHLAITRRRSYLPYGPALALGAALHVLYGDWIARAFFPGVALYLGLYDG